jgi:Ca2+-binding EF-hand superfamily protein
VITSVDRVFRRMDDDQSGELSRHEFLKGLQETGMNLTDLDLNDLFRRFDKDKSGQISYQEMIESIRVRCFAFYLN